VVGATAGEGEGSAGHVLGDDRISATTFVGGVLVVDPLGLHELELVLDGGLVADEQEPPVVRELGVAGGRRARCRVHIEGRAVRDAAAHDAVGLGVGLSSGRGLGVTGVDLAHVGTPGDHQSGIVLLGELEVVTTAGDPSESDPTVLDRDRIIVAGLVLPAAAPLLEHGRHASVGHRRQVVFGQGVEVIASVGGQHQEAVDPLVGGWAPPSGRGRCHPRRPGAGLERPCPGGTPRGSRPARPRPRRGQPGSPLRRRRPPWPLPPAAGDGALPPRHPRPALRVAASTSWCPPRVV